MTLRTYDFFLRKARLLREHRDLLKPEVIWNVERGMKITLEDMERAENARVALAQRYLAFFDRYDLLLTPATVVAPYPIENRYVAEVNGHKFANYVEWLAIAYAITVCCGTALSLPCGFTRRETAGRAADRRSAARRGAHPRRREGAGGHSRRCAARRRSSRG